MSACRCSQVSESHVPRPAALLQETRRLSPPFNPVKVCAGVRRCIGSRNIAACVRLRDIIVAFLGRGFQPEAAGRSPVDGGGRDAQASQLRGRGWARCGVVGAGFPHGSVA